MRSGSVVMDMDRLVVNGRLNSDKGYSELLAGLPVFDLVRVTILDRRNREH